MLRRPGLTSDSGGYNVPLATNPFNSWATVLDCGDIPVTSYDNTWALQQIEDGHYNLLSRAPATASTKKGPAKGNKTLPRIITLGGDHTITLPLLRSINRAYGPVSVIHFDSHLDTWKPKVFGGAPSDVASINHGTYFYHASQEGLLRNDTNIHAGIRTTLSGLSDYDNDGYCGFQIVEAREIDTIGTEGIIKKIIDRVGTVNPVYLSLDIDTLDPAFAPATGTPETGGWSTRELRTILRGLESLNLIAADIVEVAVSFYRMVTEIRSLLTVSGAACLRHQRRAHDHGCRRCAVRDHEHHGQEGPPEPDGGGDRGGGLERGALSAVLQKNISRVCK